VGFIHVANLENSVAKRISEERKTNGNYSGLEDFITRTRIPIEQLILLVRIGALRFTGKSKAQLLWESHLLLGKKPSGTGQDPLFYTPPKTYELPSLEKNTVEDVYDEVELLGFPVKHTYFDLLETSFRGEIMAKDMIGSLGKKVRMLGQLVTIKYVRTVKKEWMHFGTFIDITGHFFDTVHFPDSVKNYPFRGDGIYLLLGKIVEEFGFPSMEVQKMAKMPLKKDPRAG
jgi:DNA polymerase III alpha subunit